jgi:ribosomal protein L11 methyltransferase
MMLWRVAAEGPRDIIARAAEVMEDVDPAPLSITEFEVDKATWTLDLLYAEEADLAALARHMAQVNPALNDLRLEQAPLPNEDWIAKSLEGLKPIEAGQFFVHGGHDAAHIPAGKVAIRIEAGEAFGTGHHGTTEGCLAALAHLDRGLRPTNLLDLGTGSGILAIAAARLWPTRVLATDIDPIAVRVAEENVRLNGVAPQVQCLTATGTRHAALQARAPYDLIIANILAKPLRHLAPEIAAVIKPEGRLILSGLLCEQAHRVASVYAGWGFAVEQRLTYGEWMTLICRKA